MKIDKLIYIKSRQASIDMEIDISEGKRKPMQIFLKYWYSISPRARPHFQGDRYEFADNIWVASAIGIGEYMADVLIDFAKQHGISHAEIA